ncbi:LytR family transcriptional regulator [Sporosarcina sp. NCCP-2716]|uniref:LCP family protein n=1 Tax=Sporosarcina sp. NCCP-2716 TaxID=2943679 RepID=UPI002040D963|nr:LCP family protein [Sporosarcina sp. NCCP-2716]GKV68219.1 LytR family transcriptional regulator [Sporosarcina sp. NCCP-2716]
MAEHYEGPHPKRRRRRRLRKGRVLLTCLLVAFIGAGLFASYQYMAGKRAAAKNAIEPGSFEGDLQDPAASSVENYLLLGADDDGSGRSRTDTIMVLSWDKQAKTMKLVSFMRDIYADIPGFKSYKLNTAYYLGGVQTAKDTITGMFDLPIHHYAIVDFDNFETIADAAFPDGVEIDVEKEMSEKIGVSLMAGTHQLNGKELLGYARFRADAEGDFGRVRRQQQVLTAVKRQARTPGMLVRAPKIAGVLSQTIQTDLTSKEELSRIVSLLVSGGADIETMTVPVKGSYSFADYSHAGSVIEVNLEENRQAVRAFLDGGPAR